MQLRQSPVARGAREERGGNGVGANEIVAERFGFFSRNDHDVLAVRAVLAHIRPFLLDVTAHPAAHGGVELREIADLERSIWR